MAIQLTEQEKQLFKEGKLNPSNIEEYRKSNPIKPVDLSEVEKVKQELREVNTLYQESIERNKKLYEELVANRKRKEELRNKIAELRIKKKKILGVTE
jgi:hypothetical protein